MSSSNIPRRRGVDLDEAVVVITGASSGIGRATAQRFSAEHSRLVLAARALESLEEVAAECRQAGAASVMTFRLDVADPTAHERLVHQAVSAFGRIDVWVNNAAVMSYGTVEETPVAIQQRIIEVNLLGVMWGSRAVLPVFRRQAQGVLINVSSLYGKVATPYVSAYAASKFGILGFTQTVRQEMHDAPGVAVCAVLPGSMDTPIFRHAANYLGRQVKPVPPVSSPGRVASAIVDLAQRPRRQVQIGNLQHLVSLGHALLPRAYGDLAPGVMRFVAVGRQPQAPDPGNVLEPEAHSDALLGGWRNTWARASAATIGVAAAAATGRLLWARRTKR